MPLIKASLKSRDGRPRRAAGFCLTDHPHKRRASPSSPPASTADVPSTRATPARTRRWCGCCGASPSCTSSTRCPENCQGHHPESRLSMGVLAPETLRGSASSPCRRPGGSGSTPRLVSWPLPRGRSLPRAQGGPLTGPCRRVVVPASAFALQGDDSDNGQCCRPANRDVRARRGVGGEITGIAMPVTWDGTRRREGFTPLPSVPVGSVSSYLSPMLTACVVPSSSLTAIRQK